MKLNIFLEILINELLMLTLKTRSLKNVSLKSYNSFSTYNMF